MKSFKGGKVINFKKFVDFQYINEFGEAVTVTIQVDKNNQICDMQPRLGKLWDKFHGRPFNFAWCKAWINVYEED